MLRYKWLILVLILVIGLLIVYFFYSKANRKNSTTPQTTPAAQPPSAPEAQPQNQLAEPIADFKNRITKKPFGIYITPQNSPVQPERFTGWHTADDVEYQDITQDVPVYALADGKIVLSKTASGYGGVFMIDFKLDSAEHTAIYGHIRPSSLPQVGQEVKKGEQIALLGTGYSSETDGERRHLHFGILSDNRLDIKGYVENKSELSGWIDPLSLYP
jgi:murein DD-endopeptidase MepM/ murein hydrolase activator NlpD